MAQLFALDVAERVRSLVLISTSPATSGVAGLPPPSEACGRFLATAEVDWSSADSVVEYLVGYSRTLAGDQRRFDEEGMREPIRADVDRARELAAAQNHDLLAGDARPRGPLCSIGAPTLVIHGTADPMFPPAHGEALAREIPGARLLELAGAGHGVDRADWESIASAILAHTSRVRSP